MKSVCLFAVETTGVGGTIGLLEHCTSVETYLLLTAWTAETRFSIRTVMLHDINSHRYNNKINHILTQTQQCIFALLASVITAIIWPILYKNLKNDGYI